MRAPSKLRRGTALINVVILTMVSTAVLTLLLVASSNLTGQTRGTLEVAHTRLSARGGLSAVAAYLNAPLLNGDPFEPTTPQPSTPGFWQGAAGSEYFVLGGKGTTIAQLLAGTAPAAYFATTTDAWKASARSELATDATYDWVARVEYKTSGSEFYYHVHCLAKTSQPGVANPNNPAIRSAQCALIPDVTNPFALGLATGRGSVTFTGGGTVKLTNKPAAGTTPSASSNGTVTGNP
ncbi:MAG: hypothetical protein D6731_05200 [Planctomycetota bacterium]|nr:MAG: hypothetical protein D6731_05200 [Planctomycetota bacterium]